MPREPLKPIILSPEALIDLKDMAGDLKILEVEIGKAARAGIDVTELRARFEETKKLRIGLLREYS